MSGFFDALISRQVVKREVRLELLRDLVSRILSELVARERVSKPPMWYASLVGAWGWPMLGAVYVTRALGGPHISIVGWYELPLRENYAKFEPYIRYMVAHEFKHYLQDLATHYERQEEAWRRGELYVYPFEEEADEYAKLYSGLTRAQFLSVGDEATRIIRREAKAGVRVVPETTWG